jgi:hypothetical protein
MFSTVINILYYNYISFIKILKNYGVYNSVLIAIIKFHYFTFNNELLKTIYML